jgi:hypothetical protein
MAAQPDWLTFDVVYEPDPEAEVAALVDGVRYSRAHDLASRYPTPEYVARAVREREAHYRGCNVCFLETAEDACPEGLRLAAAAQRAMDATR